MLCETRTCSSMRAMFSWVQRSTKLASRNGTQPGCFKRSQIRQRQEALCCRIHSERVFIASGANVSSIARDSAGKPM
jgi:hypothetical protein